jgi:hypothetical protein
MKMIAKELVIRKASVPHKCNGDFNGRHALGCNGRIKIGAEYLFNHRDSSKTVFYNHSMPCAKTFIIEKKNPDIPAQLLNEYPNV